MQSDADCPIFPLVEELVPSPDVPRALLAFAALPRAILFDSAQRQADLGRYSFLAADPFDYLEVPADGSNGLAKLATRLENFTSPAVPNLPPFQGGAAGLFSYDLGRSLERVPVPAFDEFALPALAVGLYDVVLAWDHRQNKAWLISHGWPETEPSRRLRRAEQRLNEIRALLHSPAPSKIHFDHCDRLAIADLAPQFQVPGPRGLLSNFARAEYLDSVRKGIDYIEAGDIFQVNLSQRLLYRASAHALELYLRLRKRNPAPLAGYFDGGPFQIVSASPERLVSLQDRAVETRPIKGTRRRQIIPEADLFTGDELRASEKDRAENVMIVDLLRNDLSRVCQADSVRVAELCRLEVYETVQHLVSVVAGKLQANKMPLDLLRAVFPGGSITGAPKVRAMEIIAELEPTARGAYCGSLGYLGFDGAADFNILIRTVTAARGWWQIPVGGGIVAQSEPWREYEETWHKAAGMLRALEE